MLKEVRKLKDFKQTVGLITIAFFFFFKRTLKFFFKKTHLFLAVLGLHCCTGFFSSCGEPGLLCSCGPWASHCGGFSVAEDGLWGI